jgi:hypothetical protein
MATATVISVAGVMFDSEPTRTLKAGVTVMLERTRDELPAIQQLWPRFENLVGPRGRRMYAMVDTRAGTYAACTPVRAGDDPARFGLDTASFCWHGAWCVRRLLCRDGHGCCGAHRPVVCGCFGPRRHDLRAECHAGRRSAGDHRFRRPGELVRGLSARAHPQGQHRRARGDHGRDKHRRDRQAPASAAHWQKPDCAGYHVACLHGSVRIRCAAAS